MKTFFTTLGAVVAALFSSVPVQAADPVKLPVIVVFKENAPTAQYSALARFDTRMLANTDLWDYIDRGLAGMVQTLEQRMQFKATHMYSHVLQGFAAQLTAQQITALEADPTVDYVEPDGPMHTTAAQVLPWGIDKVDADVSSVRAGNGSGSVSGVTAYVIDTGVGQSISFSTVDVKVKKRVNMVSTDSNAFDCHGHGSHVAGTLGALDNTVEVVGVAPGVDIVSVRVLDCNGSGTTSDVIKGVDWVAANAVKPAVANVSLGGGIQQSLDDAVRRAVGKGVFFALAAGNSGANACNQSPARAGAGTDNGIMTTGATDRNDAAASFSNYGSCVDIWAPGVDILSLGMFSGTTKTMSGTSMAAPHVAGAAALYLSRNRTATPAQVEAALRNAAAIPGTVARDGVQIRRLNVSAF